MRPKMIMHGFTLAILVVLAAGLFPGTGVMKAGAANDPAVQIERLLSKVNRGIATSPGQAEKEWLEARSMLSQLETSDPNHAKIPALQQSIEQLRGKLEKRLGRPVGGSAPEVKAEKSVQKQQAAPEGLPSPVSSRLQKINSELDAVETSLTKNQLQTAVNKLGSAHKVMDEINSRYGDKIPDGNAAMGAALDRLTAVTEKVKQAQASAAETAGAEAAKRKQKEMQSKEWIDHFSAFTDPRSDSYLLVGAAFNAASPERQEQCRQAYAQANDVMARYQKTEFPNGKTQELLFMEPGLTDKLRLYNEGESKARLQEASREWVEKLGAFVRTGAGSRKYLIAGVTVSEDEIKEREALFREAQQTWADYQKADFPLGKSPELIQLETDMGERLAEMPEALRKSRSLLAGNLEEELDRTLAYLNKDTGWRADASKKPPIVMKRDVAPLHKALARYAGTVDAADTKLAALKEKIAQIEKLDQKNRAIGAERTFMKPNRYNGSDADALREKVSAIVKETSPAVLRITLPGTDWKEEEVLEWTDTTHTAARHRITKSMTAQAAAKSDDGKVYLHGVHLAADRKGDGSWGPLYGHIMWSDWMADGNVDK